VISSLLKDMNFPNKKTTKSNSLPNINLVNKELLMKYSMYNKENQIIEEKNENQSESGS
jgi:hypothetical protein